MCAFSRDSHACLLQLVMDVMQASMRMHIITYAESIAVRVLHFSAFICTGSCVSVTTLQSYLWECCPFSWTLMQCGCVLVSWDLHKCE